MSFLTTNELSDLRTEVLDLLPDTCDIKRRTITIDKGHQSESVATVADDIQCRVDPLQRNDADGIVADAEKGTTFWQLSLPYDANVQDGDLVTFDSDDYQIVQLHNDHSARIVRRAVMVRHG